MTVNTSFESVPDEKKCNTGNTKKVFQIFPIQRKDQMRPIYYLKNLKLTGQN